MVRKNSKGITLVEILIAAAILGITLVGLMRLYFYCSSLVNLSREMGFCLLAAQDTLQDMRTHPFAQITTDYGTSGTPGNMFTLTDPPAAGVIRTTAVNADLLEVDIVVSWQSHDGRIVGEDVNLNGVLDAGEDSNGNGELDAPLQLMSYIAQR